jgi:hypothetical protein
MTANQTVVELGTDFEGHRRRAQATSMQVVTTGAGRTANLRLGSFRCSDVPAVIAPGKAWERRMLDELKPIGRSPAGESPAPAKVGHRPEPSVAWRGGNPGCEAYTGGMQAAVMEPRKVTERGSRRRLLSGRQHQGAEMAWRRGPPGS